MPRVIAFLKRHLLWTGFLAVMIPLLVLLFLQYRSLTALEAASPARHKEELTGFLQAIVHEVETYYRREATRALALPPTTIGPFVDNHIVVPGKMITQNALPLVTGATGHFQTQPFPGTKARFFAIKMLCEGKSLCSIFFYDAAREVIKREMKSPLWVASQQAASSYCTKISLKTNEPPDVVGVKIQPEYYFLLKPLLGTEGQLLGVVGAELDAHYLRTTLLPQAIRKVADQYFPTEQSDIVVTVQEANGQRWPNIQSEDRTEAEVQLSSNLVFRDWKFEARRRGLSQAQLARRVFTLNISISVLMAALLSGGLWLALRIAAREMKLSQMKSDFVSNVSHELRTPLSSIRVFGELLGEGRVTETEMVREFGVYIETESARLTQLINKILDFSRIESGHKVYDFVSTDWREVIAETFRAEALRLKQEGFVLRLELPPTPLPPVRMDVEAIAQAFVNLLDNAAKYSGSARAIEVCVARQGKYATLAVTDHGIGIPAAEHEKIFEKFYRVGSSLVHDVKGSGLGLSIVRHIVEAHSGRITVASKPGQGSVFTIWLPLAAAAAATVEIGAALDPSLEGR